MHKRYSFPGIVVTSPEPIKEETETPLIGRYQYYCYNHRQYIFTNAVRKERKLTVLESINSFNHILLLCIFMVLMATLLYTSTYVTSNFL